MASLIETAAGAAMRRIPPALPPRLAGDHGKAVEDVAQGAAMLWGMPDFVFRPLIRRVGTGSRELGDGVLTTGDLALAMQVKARPDPTPNPDPEETWVRKMSAKAFRQANGTIRQLCAEPAEMVNARGRALPVDGCASGRQTRSRSGPRTRARPRPRRFARADGRAARRRPRSRPPRLRTAKRRKLGGRRTSVTDN